jgi:hypothetical protein
MTPLRQIDDAAKADAYLFKPAAAVNMPAPNEQGTPLPKDEPFAENPPLGAVIDYDLKTAPAGPVTLEILDGAGQVLRRYSSEDKPALRDPNTLNIPAIWSPAPEVLSAAVGMHRWIWDLRLAGDGRSGGGGRGGGALAQPGAYSVRLTVDGQTFTQPLIVKHDPRL